MEFNGLPLHILLVHFVVVLVPLSSLLIVVHAVWPQARRRIGFVTPLVALICMILVPIVTDAGEWLQERVAATPLVAQHVALGLTLYPWAIWTFVVSMVLWIWYGFIAGGKRPLITSKSIRLVVFIVLAVAAIAIAVGTTLDVIQIGEAGSKAVWDNSFSQTPQ